MDCQVCRLCGCQRRNLKPIFLVTKETSSPTNLKSNALNLADLIHRCIGLHVKENEDLPQNVCKICLKALTSWHTFYERSKIIQHRFERIIEKKKVCISPATNHHATSNSPRSEETKAVPCMEICQHVTSTMGDSPTRALSPLMSRKSKAYSYIKKKRILKATTKEETKTPNTGDHISSDKEEQILADCSIKNTDETSSNNIKITVATSFKNSKNNDEIALNNTKNIGTSLNSTKLIFNAPKKSRHIRLPVYNTNASPLHLQCRFCEKVYPSKRTYNRHISMHTDLKEFRCATCLKVYRSKQSLQAHLETHSESRNYVCHICGQSYQTASTLCNHIQRQHREDRAFTCSTCGKQFRHGHHLEQHMRMHTGIKPFSCSECPRQFGCAAYLRRHIEAIHLNTKRHVCATCGKQYLHTTHFKAHLLRHSGLRAFKCSTCDKAFVTRNELMKHERIHSRLKPFQCPLCDKAFSDWSNRKRHIATHEGPLPKQRKANSKRKTYASLQTFYQCSESFASTMDEGFVNIEYVNLTVLSTQNNTSSNNVTSDGDSNGEGGQVPQMKASIENDVDNQTGKDDGILFVSTKRLDPHINNEIIFSSTDKSGHGLSKIVVDGTSRGLKVPSTDKREMDRKPSSKPSVCNLNGLDVFLENGHIETAGVSESFLQTLENSVGNSEENRISNSKESIVRMLSSQGTVVLATSSGN